VAELDRIRWHCRRGLLELDLILERFNSRHLTTLDADGLEQFKELLALDDNDLLDLIMERATLTKPRLVPLLRLLQAV
jgi:succinate dehydrogenase flavin-adding protein (antitoxin of CptAB toxin-antitoxin module)